MATRWGICGAGRICHDFAACLVSELTPELQVVAVAARDLGRAQDFAKQFNIPKAYGSYKELAKDPEVDVVYIGTIHPEHYRQTLLFLSNGKHVLVEKPIAMNLKQLTEMTSLAREKKLFLMEGLWSRFFPLYKRVEEEITSENIGELRYISANFCKPIGDVERVQSNALGGGALLCLGVYPLHIATYLFGRPDQVFVEGNMMSSSDVDETICVTFKYNNGRMAQLFSSVAFQGTNDLMLFGTKGHIKIHNPMWCPTEVTLPSGKVTFDLPTVSGPFNFPNSEGLVYEALHVRQCLQDGKTESPLLPLSHAEFVMGVVEQVKRSVGLRYNIDA